MKRTGNKLANGNRAAFRKKGFHSQININPNHLRGIRGAVGISGNGAVMDSFAQQFHRHRMMILLRLGDGQRLGVPQVGGDLVGKHFF